MSEIVQTKIVQRYLDGYLNIFGIDDPKARIEGGGLSRVYGVRGTDRAKADGRVNYVLPPGIMVEINRATHDIENPDDRIGSYDSKLVETIHRALDGNSSLDQTVVDELKAHYESANVHAPGEAPKPKYWDDLVAYWKNLKADSQALQSAD